MTGMGLYALEAAGLLHFAAVPSIATTSCSAPCPGRWGCSACCWPIRAGAGAAGSNARPQGAGPLLPAHDAGGVADDLRPAGQTGVVELLKVPALLALSCSATGLLALGAASRWAAGPLRGTGGWEEADPSPLKAEWGFNFYSSRIDKLRVSLNATPRSHDRMKLLTKMLFTKQSGLVLVLLAASGSSAPPKSPTTTSPKPDQGRAGCLGQALIRSATTTAAAASTRPEPPLPPCSTAPTATTMAPCCSSRPWPAANRPSNQSGRGAGLLRRQQ